MPTPDLSQTLADPSVTPVIDSQNLPLGMPLDSIPIEDPVPINPPASLRFEWVQPQDPTLDLEDENEEDRNNNDFIRWFFPNTIHSQ